MDDEKGLVPQGEQRETEIKPAPARPNIATPGGLPATTTDGVNGVSSTPLEAPAAPLVTEPGRTGGGGGLGRPMPSRQRAARRKQSSPWGWIFILVVGIAAGVGVFFWIRGNQTNTTFQGLTASPTTRQAVTLAVSATGQIQANADVALSFGSAGTITEVKVKPGDIVKQGQELARIDDNDLQNSVKTAKAQLEQQQANLKKITDGASQKDLETAQASLKGAQAKYQQAKNGNALPAEIGNAQASIGSAQAQLNSAQAKLAQDLQGGSAADKAAAASGISSAEAQLASAQAGLTSAQAKLAKDQAGPDFATITSAQAKVDQAQAGLDSKRSQLQSAVVSAQTTRDQALNALRTAQDKYASVYNDNHNPDGSLRDGLAQTKIDNETTAYRALQDAQATYNKSEAALNDAKVQLDAGLRTAKSQLDDAKASLDKTKAGPTTADIAADQASVASGQSSVASAQASLDSAKKTQAALAPTDATIAADRASVASAQASIASGQSGLAKLQGGTANDVENAQATIDQANATLNDLLAGPKPNDIAVQQAVLNQQQANLDNALVKLKNAVIVAPFDGVVVLPAATTQVANPALPVIGQAITANSTLFQLVDFSSLHVDVNVGENDVAKVKLGQAVAVNLDAISGRSFSGKVTYISSKSAVSNNVVNYLVTVTVDAGTANSFNDVWGAELAKYFAAIAQGQNRTGAGGQGQGAGAGGLPPGVRIPAAFLSQLGVCGYIPSFPGAAGANTDQPKVGMTANVTVCQSLKAGVLSVANRAIKTKTENGRRIQYLPILKNKETSEIVDVPVSTGLVGDTNTEITAGDLKETDLIVLSTTPTNRTAGAAAAGGIPAPPGGGGGGGPGR